MKDGIAVVESARPGKAMKGRKVTSSWQVREYNHTGSYMLRKQFRFTVGDKASRFKAHLKAQFFADRL